MFVVCCCVILSAFVLLCCIMLCVCIFVWFCYYVFLYCIHVYCKFVCYLLSINVGTNISIPLYDVYRYAIYSYVFSLLDVHSMYVHYLYPCIYNSSSCIVVCFVLFCFTRYVCGLICYCHSENSSNFAFLGVVPMLLYQDLPQMITTNLYHDKLHYVKKSIWT